MLWGHRRAEAETLSETYPLDFVETADVGRQNPLVAERNEAVGHGWTASRERLICGFSDSLCTVLVGSTAETCGSEETAYVLTMSEGVRARSLNG